MSFSVLDYFDDLYDLEYFVGLAGSGLEYGKYLDRITELMRNAALRGDKSPAVQKLRDDNYYQYRKEKEVKLKKFAENEISNRNPYLYSLVIIKLLSILSAVIDNVFSTVLKNPSDLPQDSRIRKIKTNIFTYLDASDDQRIEIIKETFLNEINPVEKIGIGRFEIILRELGFNGSVDEYVRKALLELIEIRNVIVHRNSIVDQKLITRCPWIKWEKNDRIHLNEADFSMYHRACMWYIIEIDRRTGGESFEKPKEAKEIMDDFQQDVEKLWDKFRKKIE